MPSLMELSPDQKALLDRMFLCRVPGTGFPALSPDIPDKLTLALAVCQDVSVVRAAPEIGLRVGAFYTLLSSRLRRGARAGREKQEAELLTRTPPRKIRRPYQECKHTWL